MKRLVPIGTCNCSSIVRDADGVPHLGVSPDSSWDWSGCSREEVEDAPTVAPPPPTSIPQYALLEFLAAHGMEDAILDELALPKNRKAAVRFYAAQSIEFANPWLLGLLPDIATALGKTVDELKAMLAEAATHTL